MGAMKRRAIFVESVLPIAAIICTAMGLFSLPLLSDDAWKMAAIFSASGLLLSALGLRFHQMNNRRLLWIVACSALAVFIGAMWMRA